MPHRLCLLVASLSLLCAGTGCRLIAAPFLLWGEEQTRDVPADYPYLANKDVLVLIWADQATLFDYQYLRHDLGAHIGQALEAKVPGVKCVPARIVATMQDREPDWDQTAPATLGRRFRADRVMLVEVLECGTREAGATHLYRGRITANVAIYDPQYGADAGPVWETEDAIKTIYPTAGPGLYSTTDAAVRRTTMEQFALQLAGKFYDRVEKISERR